MLYSLDATGRKGFYSSLTGLLSYFSPDITVFVPAVLPQTGRPESPRDPPLVLGLPAGTGFSVGPGDSRLRPSCLCLQCSYH